MFYRMRYSFEDDPTGEILIASGTKNAIFKTLATPRYENIIIWYIIPIRPKWSTLKQIIKCHGCWISRGNR